MKKMMNVVRFVLAVGFNAIAKIVFGIGYAAMVVFVVIAMYLIVTHVHGGFLDMSDDMRETLLLTMCAVGTLLLVGLGGEMWTSSMVRARKQALACI